MGKMNEIRNEIMKLYCEIEKHNLLVHQSVAIHKQALDMNKGIYDHKNTIESMTSVELKQAIRYLKSQLKRHTNKEWEYGAIGDVVTLGGYREVEIRTKTTMHYVMPTNEDLHSQLVPCGLSDDEHVCYELSCLSRYASKHDIIFLKMLDNQRISLFGSFDDQYSYKGLSLTNQFYLLKYPFIKDTIESMIERYSYQKHMKK